MKVYLRIDGSPGVKQRPRFYNGHAITAKETVMYENLIKQMWMVSRQQKLNGLIKATIKAYFPIPKSYTKKRLKEIEEQGMYCPNVKDIDNVAKICLDGLNQLAYDDDRQIVVLQVEKYYSYDPRMEIEIEEVQP